MKRGGTKRKAAEPGPPARGARHGGAEAAAGGEGSSSLAGHLLLSLSEELVGPAAGTSGQRGGWGDAGSSLGSACLRGAGRWDGGSILQGLRETGGVWFVHLPLPGPWHWGWIGIILGAQAAVQREEPRAALETATRQSGAVSALEMLCRLRGGCSLGRVRFEEVESTS